MMKIVDGGFDFAARRRHSRSNRSAKLRLLAATCLATAFWSVPTLAQDAAVQLDTVTVEGASDSPVGPDDGYVAKDTLTGSKTDTPLSEFRSRSRS